MNYLHGDSFPTMKSRPHSAPFASHFGSGRSSYGAHLGPHCLSIRSESLSIRSVSDQKASVSLDSHGLIQPEGLGYHPGHFIVYVQLSCSASCASLLSLGSSSQTDPLSAHLSPSAPGMSHRPRSQVPIIYHRCEYLLPSQVLIKFHQPM